MARNQADNFMLDLFQTSNEFERLEENSLHIIEREFDDFCVSFSIQPNALVNCKSHTASSTPFFTPNSPYELSEFCKNYKSKNSTVEPDFTKFEIEHEASPIEQIENILNKETDILLKSSTESIAKSQCTKLDPKQKRIDVELKSCIRTIRRYIKDKFRAHNARLMSRRLCNVGNRTIVKQVLKMILKMLPQELCTYDLAKYIIGICKLKPISKFKLSDELVDDINLFLSCAKHCSYVSFTKLVSSNAFQNLCKAVDQNIIPDFLRQEIEKCKQ